MLNETAPRRCLSSSFLSPFDVVGESKGGVAVRTRAASEPNITSVEDLLTLMRSLPWEQARFYFRGESRGDEEGKPRQLLPALLRSDTLQRLRDKHKCEDPIDIQRFLLRRLQRYVPMDAASEFASLVREGFSGDALCVAQHHGLPTLLLDWTLSPLAALYFAVLKHKERDSRVWYMALKPADQRMEHTVHLEEGEPLKERSEVPVLVVPRPFSRRIEAQVGRFIYFGLYTGPLEAYRGFAPFTSIGSWKIAQSDKLSIRDELAKLQIHGGTMFPGLDGYARYLADGGL